MEADKMTDTQSQDDLRRQALVATAEIVSNYVRANRILSNELTDLIQNVHANLMGLSGEPAETKEVQTPAVPIRKSVQRDVIYCLECGAGQRTLKRHLATSHDMTPEEYRAKWSLPSDYPLTAPAYAEQRSQLAKSLGLGRKPGEGKKSAQTKTNQIKTSEANEEEETDETQDAETATNTKSRGNKSAKGGSKNKNTKGAKLTKSAVSNEDINQDPDNLNYEALDPSEDFEEDAPQKEEEDAIA